MTIYVMDIPIVVLASTPEEAKEKIIRLLNKANIEFDTTCVGMWNPPVKV